MKRLDQLNTLARDWTGPSEVTLVWTHDAGGAKTYAHGFETVSEIKVTQVFKFWKEKEAHLFSAFFANALCENKWLEEDYWPSGLRLNTMNGMERTEPC